VSESSSVTSEEEIPVAAATEVALKKVQNMFYIGKLQLLLPSI
jgi:hypothetical protein